MTKAATTHYRPGALPRLLTAAQQGDEAAQRELFRSFEPLVSRVVWRLLPPVSEREDIAQEARIGLLLAIRAWRAERGPFPAFADRCVSNQALLAMKARCTRNQHVLIHAIPLEEPDRVPSDDAHDPTDPPPPAPSWLEALSPEANPGSRLLARERLATVLRALPMLSPSERAGLAISLNGGGYAQLAARNGSTVKAARKAAYRARLKLSAALAHAA